LREPESGVAVLLLAGADVERQALAAGIGVHELGDRAAVAGQQAASHQLIALACQLRRAQLLAQAFR
jgi:hypothetical protein